MTRQRRALIIAFHFPPSRGSGTYRTLAWANRFAAAGWDTSVLTVDRRWFTAVVGDMDERLEELIDPRVRVIRIRQSHESAVSDIRSLKRLHANFPDPYDEFHGWLNRQAFPEVQGLWYPAATARAVRHGVRRRPDVVLGTGNPFATLAAARAVGRLFRVPYAVDFHDAWTLNQVTGTYVHQVGSEQWRWERRLIAGAVRVYTVNDALARWYTEEHPAGAGRVRVVENGWEPAVLADLPDPVAVTERPVRFGYVGTFRSDLPVEQFFQAWRLAREQGAALGATFDLYGHLGYFGRNSPGIRARLPLGTDAVTYRGPVSQRELGRTFATLDVLVSLLPSSPYVTSGKVYDYVASRRPVVAVHSPDTGASGVAGSYPMWCPAADLSVGSIAAAIEHGAQTARRLTPELVEQARAFAARRTWAAAIDPAIIELESHLHD